MTLSWPTRQSVVRGERRHERYDSQAAYPAARKLREPAVASQTENSDLEPETLRPIRQAEEVPGLGPHHGEEILRRTLDVMRRGGGRHPTHAFLRRRARRWRPRGASMRRRGGAGHAAGGEETDGHTRPLVALAAARRRGEHGRAPRGTPGKRRRPASGRAASAPRGDRPHGGTSASQQRVARGSAR